MPTHADRLLRCVRLLASQAGPATTDAELLACFLTGRDPAAFEALVARHGPMVLRVCQHVLGNRHDAEDAFQATFLVLARKAASIRPPGHLASWLHGVAYHVALGARTAARRRHREPLAPDLAPPDPRPDPLAELTAREALQILEEEVQRLPQAYRLPVILCCLQGLTQEEVARQLGWTPGLVKGRLERGRKLLRTRLTRRGLSLPAALLGTTLAQGTAPAALVASTVRAGLAFAAAGSGSLDGIAPTVLLLAQRGRRGIATILMQLVVTLTLTVGVAAAGAGLLMRWTPADRPAPGPGAESPQPGGAKQAPEEWAGDPLPAGAVARMGSIRFWSGSTVQSVAFAADGKTLASGHADGMVHLWHADTGKEMGVLKQPPTPVMGLAFSSDGKVLATRGGGVVFQDNSIRLWEVSTGRERHRFGASRSEFVPSFEGSPGWAFRLAFSPDGKLLASGAGDVASRDNLVRFWDVATGKELRQCRGHTAIIRCFAFASDGKTLASGSADRTVRLWDPATGKELRRLEGRSRIDLLPHQLWVCKKVLERWPARWLVADDVGLGKTIEAGLVLLPLVASGRVKRLLIICPAGLVEQWQYRLRDLFDVRTQVYAPEGDRPGRDFWGPPVLQVVASLQTLRLDNGGRWERLLAADPWDLVLVDEAHHLNSDEEDAATHGYRLLKKMRDANRIRALVFFTGTPHRGKDYNFLALLALLRPDLFDPERPMSEQLPPLPQAVIRNNKQTVTDLEGKPLFRPPVVKFERYTYSPEEARFYALLTEFILSGKAYASHQGDRERRAIMLVLIALQKLASSSVAAFRAAVRGRADRLRSQREELDRKKELFASVDDYSQAIATGDEDAANGLAERLGEVTARLRLMQDEEARLTELLAAADAVRRETKIDRILDLIDGPFAGRQVLLFTEYKATQAAVLEALSARHGRDCAVFINGDDAVANWTNGGRSPASLWSLPRTEAANRFNAGGARFLVSTEAGGEGIDLQERCHSLIHVDLPWNPMRLHQRVGRINRYGQTKTVEVFSLRNEDTVEALIWEHLEAKLEQITRALGQVMDDPEDMKQLVLGMASPSLFQTLFADAPRGKDSVKDWFDSQTATLGGRDMIAAVRDLVGHCARFDFGKVAAQVPRIDLPDLEPFLVTLLELNQRRATRTAEGLSFLTPQAWEDEPGVLPRYERMTFDRRAAGRDAQRVLGVGHKVIDLAVKQARDLRGGLAFLPAAVLLAPVFVFRLTDQTTGGGTTVRCAAAGVEDRPNGPVLLRDWELLQRLNQVTAGRSLRGLDLQDADGQRRADRLRAAQEFVRGQLATLELPYQIPHAELVGVLWPAQARSAQD
jgi:RNA polymerase sigma factor (sigma-70 family)